MQNNSQPAVLIVDDEDMVITSIRAGALARVSLARVAVVTGMFINSSSVAFARSAVFTCPAAVPVTRTLLPR